MMMNDKNDTSYQNGHDKKPLVPSSTTTTTTTTTFRTSRRPPIPPPPQMSPIPTPPTVKSIKKSSSSYSPSLPLPPPPHHSSSYHLPAPRDLENDFTSNQQQQQQQRLKKDAATTTTTTMTTVPGRARRRMNHPPSNTTTTTTTTPFTSPSSAATTNLSIRQRRKNRRATKLQSSSNTSSKLQKLWYTLFPPSSSSSSSSKDSPSSSSSSSLSIPNAVLLWYLLGVISITTSKVLLTDYKQNGMTPSLLTLQQFCLGITFLRGCMMNGYLGGKGILVLKKVISSGLKSPSSGSGRGAGGFAFNFKKSSSSASSSTASSSSVTARLFLTGIFFSFGFWATNYSFQGSAASFVETVKAAEPITSASVAVLWKIEVLSWEEAVSLGGIVVGVLISTLANGMMATSATTVAAAEVVGHGSTNTLASSSLGIAIKSCVIVMISNLCFSFRGLYQKMFRASPQGNASVMDDLNLQYRMQQIGVMVCMVPALLFDMPTVIRGIWEVSDKVGFIRNGVLLRYISLALVNGVAFTSYNLASTYILTRISVVHHAALNCIRRVFAIVVTSIAFGVPITLLSAFGITISVVGFFSFSHYKMERLRRPRPLSSLLPMSAV